MKRLILLFTTLLLLTVTNAQELNENSAVLKDMFPEQYELVKSKAVEKWEDNHAMVVHEINKQLDSFMAILEKLKTSSDLEIFKYALKKWSYEGYEAKNMKLYDRFMTDTKLDVILSARCNWPMVEHEFKKQAKAKNSY